MILSIFRYFLVHNFHKNQYFQKPISLPSYIFQGGSFDVSNIKIYFFQIFFIQGSPLWFLKTLIGNEKSTISVRKKIKTDLKSVGKTLSFAPCDDEFFFWNHPTVHKQVIVKNGHFVPKKKTENLSYSCKETKKLIIFFRISSKPHFLA